MTDSVAEKSFLSGIQYEHLVAGLSGGVTATLITHPFDLLKLRFAGEFENVQSDCINPPQYMMVLTRWGDPNTGECSMPSSLSSEMMEY